MRFLFEEHVNELTSSNDVDLSSFDIKQNLCPEFWDDNNKLNPYVRRTLLAISKNIINGLGITGFTFEDIIITGSIANYNWNENFSDIDLHIIVNFLEIHKDTELVKKFFDYYKKNWNGKHRNISIFGYPVEIYIQDSTEEHKSTGVYSIMTNDWIIKPNKHIFDKNEVDDDNVKTQVASFMNEIDELEAELEEGDPTEIGLKTEDIFDRLKKIRKEYLSKGNELNDGNLIFKTLRRNGYMEKLLDIRTKAYDKHFSI